jgi:hypothetical protein
LLPIRHAGVRVDFFALAWWLGEGARQSDLFRFDAPGSRCVQPMVVAPVTACCRRAMVLTKELAHLLTQWVNARSIWARSSRAQIGQRSMVG